MSSLSCPACAKLATVAANQENAICICPSCGQCLRVPQSWRAGSGAGPIVPVVAVPPVSLGWILAGVALVSALVGGLFFLGQGLDHFFKIMAVLAIAMLLICIVVLVSTRVRSQRSQTTATVLEASPDWPADLFKLGQLRAGYQTAAGYSGGRLVLFGVVSAACGATGIAARLSGHPDSRWLEVALVCSFAGLVAIITGVRNLLWRVRVLVFDEGLAHIKGSEVRMCRWDEIAAVFQNWTEQNADAASPICRIELHGGESWRLDGQRLAGIENLANVIDREMTVRLLPEAEEALERGATIEFGPVGVSAAGIRKSGATLPWPEVAEIKIDRGQLIVIGAAKRLAWCQVSLSELPNWGVFRDLVSAQTHITY